MLFGTTDLVSKNSIEKLKPSNVTLLQSGHAALPKPIGTFIKLKITPFLYFRYGGIINKYSLQCIVLFSIAYQIISFHENVARMPLPPPPIIIKDRVVKAANYMLASR